MVLKKRKLCDKGQKNPSQKVAKSMITVITYTLQLGSHAGIHKNFISKRVLFDGNLNTFDERVIQGGPVLICNLRLLHIYIYKFSLE